MEQPCGLQEWKLLVKSLCHPGDYYEIPVRVCQTRRRSWVSFAWNSPTCHSPIRRVAHLRIWIAIVFEVKHLLCALTLMEVSSLRAPANLVERPLRSVR